MKSLPWLLLCAFGLSCVPSPASADEPSLVDWAQRRVEDGLVKPLAQVETISFARVRPAPHERRVRITATTATPDKSGHPFVSFAVDVRFGAAEWRANDQVGCVYKGSGDLFVKVGNAYRPAAFLLGKNLAPVAGACEPAAPVRS